MNLKELDFRKIILIITVSIFLGIVYNFFNSRKIDFIRSEKNLEWASDSLIGNVNEIREPKIYEPKLISLQQAYGLYAKGGVIFIDARDQWDFSASHISGAINIPEFKYSPDMPETQNLEKEKTYVIYCGDEECDTSIRLAMELSKSGFTSLFIFEGGWYVWSDAGYPTIYGEEN